MAESGGSANPASVYCADLGGVEWGARLTLLPGWVNPADPADVAELCVFPYRLIIDSQGLAYHTMGNRCGAGPGLLFRWKPESTN